ncbi:hypothetical protein KOR42_36260 [Thalassoglobus neptunius]|uniref:ImpA N-terminal domain-containing protein n=1 Tax=Thalassoglobus neptunius TaxID=1938619 RepID=A0A5C5WHE6_9PLAN|nr:type VI secretion system protein TssA [Thalassoglobus neptunius]TWT50080.1 hypothetical protein KOR42_36260 [Thalassoglobus neptunius]
MGTDVDLPLLLEPISEDQPGGVDLRDDDDPNNIFRRVKDARNSARQEETQSDQDGESSASSIPFWREVWDEGQEYLRTQAKDLEIAAYMIEAAIRLDGFAGFAKSIELTTELVTRFWGELLPTPDEDGIETTLLPIARLNGDVIAYPLMRVPLTSDGSFGHLVMWQYIQAQQIEQLDPAEREVRISRGAVTLEQFRQAIAETPTEFFTETRNNLAKCQAELERLNDVFSEQAGDEFAPNLSKFESAIREAENVLVQLAGDRLSDAVDVDDSEEQSEAESSGESGAGAPPPKRDGIQSRNDAFDILEKVARWIEQHEPQSLLPSEIRKVIRRGKMTPQELYEDLISDSDVRRSLYRDVGIVVPEEEY